MNFKKALSLIEVTLSLLILILIIGGILGIFSYGFSAIKNSAEKLTALNLARYTLEEYSDWNKLDEVDGSLSDGVNNGVYTLSSISANGISYNRTLIIQNGPVNPTELKEVLVNISWGGGKFINVTALKANY